MTKTNVRSGIVGLAFGLLSFLTLALAGVSPAVAGPSSTRMMHESVTVIAVDRATRFLTLQNIDGETKTVQVPAEVKAFDTVKVGDHVDIDYSESMAVSLLPPGSKPSLSESSEGLKASASGATRSHQMTASAEILSIDRVTNKVTFKGPRGDTQTVAVTDPAMQTKLASLKPGQVVQITYTEAVAAAIRPAPMAVPPAQKTP